MKHERDVQRAEVGGHITERADSVHAVVSRVPFWRLDDTGEEFVIRDLDGPPMATFHGIYAAERAG